MQLLGVLASVVLILLVLMDAFESIVQPRRVTRRYRWARVYYLSLWTFWHFVARRIAVGKRQAAFLSVFGPLSLLGIFATWVIGLIVAFALLNWSAGGHDSCAPGRSRLSRPIST